MLTTLTDIERVVRASWSRETCDPASVDEWCETNPARGQCGVTSLVLHELLGGRLLLAEVHYPNGEREGVHYWNRLASDVEVDLTREQFLHGESIDAPRTVDIPPDAPRRCREQYELLRSRVLEALAGW